jgi:hypothetical protein
LQGYRVINRKLFGEKGVTTMIRALLLLLAMTTSPLLQAADLPPAFKVQYAVKKGPLVMGHSVRELEYASDGGLVFRSASDTSGLADLLLSEHIQEISYLQKNAQRIRPYRYEYLREGRRNRRISQQFDWQEGSVTSKVDGKIYDYPVPPLTFDANGYQVNLMVDLASGVRDIDYSIAGSKRLRTYDIRHIGDEQIQTVLGKLDTVVIRHKASQTTTLWCAKDLHFLPVKIEHQENGGTFTAYLESVTGLGVDSAGD